jgi:hypothetical protein
LQLNVALQSVFVCRWVVNLNRGRPIDDFKGEFRCDATFKNALHLPRGHCYIKKTDNDCEEAANRVTSGVRLFESRVPNIVLNE